MFEAKEMQIKRKGIRNFNRRRVADFLIIMFFLAGVLIGSIATGVDYELWYVPLNGISAFSAALACLAAAYLVFMLAYPPKPKGPKKAVILPVSTEEPTKLDRTTVAIFNQINGY